MGLLFGVQNYEKLLTDTNDIEDNTLIYNDIKL